MNARRLKRARARALGWKPAHLRIYTHADLRTLDPSTTIMPVVHKAWVAAVDAGGIDCARCAGTLAFANGPAPWMIGEARIRHDRRRQIIVALCSSCCLRFHGPEEARAALCAAVHQGIRGRRLFTFDLDEVLQ
jgi:hypothetical protein